MSTRIVLVRPDRPAHTLIAAAFEMSGCEVHCASDVRTAWTLAVQKRPLVLLIEYPEQVEDGLELLHRAAALRGCGTIVAVAVSNALSPEGTAAIASQTDLCYRMPKSPADVVRAILRHASGARPPDGAPATPGDASSAFTVTLEDSATDPPVSP